MHTRVAWGTFEITEAPSPTPQDSVSQALGPPGWLYFHSPDSVGSQGCQSLPKAPPSRLRLTSHYILPLRLGQPGAIFLPGSMDGSHLCRQTAYFPRHRSPPCEHWL